MSALPQWLLDDADLAMAVRRRASLRRRVRDDYLRQAAQALAAEKPQEALSRWDLCLAVAHELKALPRRRGQAVRPVIVFLRLADQFGPLPGTAKGLLRVLA